MRYASSFTFSPKTIRNTNIYPYNVFNPKAGQTIPLDRVTMLYGDNGSGKSTILSIIAHTLGIIGAERPKTFGTRDFFTEYVNECGIGRDFGNDDLCRVIPKASRLIKSEDILYEIKKVQQEAVLMEGHVYDRMKFGMTRAEAVAYKSGSEMGRQLERIAFAQEKYSNGETALQVFEDHIQTAGLFLLDEPEVSLSPGNQLRVAKMIEEAARFHAAQFVISTHSPFVLGSLDGTILDLNCAEILPRAWHELENVRAYARFFLERRNEFGAGFP
jgi:predicted ATPase